MSIIVPEPIHDWTVAIRDGWYGIVEYPPSLYQGAVIYYGDDLIETSLSAYAILGIAVGSVAAFFVILWLVLTKLTPPKSAGS